MWALVDCDNFFCSCERVFRPDLEGHPVVVLSNNDGCVVARSREVKAMGVKMGMPYFKLLEEYPRSGITAFSSNYELYADMSARVMSVLREAAPEMVQYSIDESFLRLDGMDLATLKVWGEALAAKVRRWTGIPVSMGIASSKTLAKAASKYAKKYPGYRRCCFIATEEQRRKALAGFPAADVWGIGRRIARQLEAYGLATALQFADLKRSWVRTKFHVTGERTWGELNGEDLLAPDPIEHTRQSIMTSRSFPGMIDKLEGVRTHVANFAARCAAKLRRQKSVAGIVSVFVSSNSFRTDLEQYHNMASRQLDTPTSSTIDLVKTACSVLDLIFKPGILYKRAGVMVTDIRSGEVVQPDLFTFDAGEHRRNRNISQSIDRINAHLGADTVVLASQMYPEKSPEGKNRRYVDSINRALKSPDYTHKPDSFKLK